jgi:hypothetical protein
MESFARLVGRILRRQNYGVLFAMVRTLSVRVSAKVNVLIHYLLYAFSSDL